MLLRHVARRMRVFARAARTRAIELRQMVGSPAHGSAHWLIQREVHYGGYVTNVARNRVSVADPRTPGQLAFGGMTGGDRMLHNGYGPAYEEFLAPFVQREQLTIVEVGILRGSGLAIWCDLFPSGRIIGLDIDLGHFEENRRNLERRGAFVNNKPEVKLFDQLLDGPAKVGDILGGSRVDILIDDGLHSSAAIANTFSAFEPHLSEEFVAFIEDTDLLNPAVREVFEQYDLTSRGSMHVIRRRISSP